MSNFIEKEDLLCLELRSYCDSKGQEVVYEKSAVVLNKLGLLYKQRSPDKINLIQSAALLNAAVARQPSNKNFQKDLFQLCKHIVCIANSKSIKANLIDIAKCVKNMISRMRSDTNAALQNMKRTPDTITIPKVLKEIEKRKIKQVKMLQDQIAQQYTDIMAFISKCCIDIMGKPPCRFALIGMGSLARKEITSYSDFEHIIVLENIANKKKNPIQSTLEYFRWYSTIFHVIVINLQETIIPSVYIRGLNDFSTPKGNWFFDKFTTRGISFDGMMPHACKFPLGRTQTTVNKNFTVELIKPVSEMVRYLTVEEDLKNGYKLADILTKTCFVSGDINLYQYFLNETYKIQYKPNQRLENFTQILHQLCDDLNKFNVHNILEMFSIEKSLNIKHVLYRTTTIFISTLGRIHNSKENSNFTIIEDFLIQGMIDEDTAHRLAHAVALACHFRLS